MLTGDKYNSNLTTTEIAALVRKEIKEAIKAGMLPKVKVSIRTEYFAGGSSISIDVKALPAGMRIYSREYVEAKLNAEPGDYYCKFCGERYTPEAKMVIETLHDALNAYNYKDIDSQTDYFNVRFYDHVEFDDKLLDADLKATIEEIRRAA